MKQPTIVIILLVSMLVGINTIQAVSSGPVQHLETKPTTLMIGSPPRDFVAEQINNTLTLSWRAPEGYDGTWIHYDNGFNYDSIGTGGAADFDVAIRFPASALQQYAGSSLQQIKVMPMEAGTFSIRVWTGGTSSAPADLVVDQPFVAELGTYNTITLDNPVPITGTQPIWFGYRCVVTTGYPAGCDSGPAINTYGNMIYLQGAWHTLLSLDNTLNYNWNIQGYVGEPAPSINRVSMTPLYQDHNRISIGNVKSSGTQKTMPNSVLISNMNERELTGYLIWRLTPGNETIENTWAQITPNPINTLTMLDNEWLSLSPGLYRWAIKALFTDDELSDPAFSNLIDNQVLAGTLAGSVRDHENQPIPNVLILASNFSTTTNQAGEYSFILPGGTYTVSATNPNYVPSQQTNVVINMGQTTTLDFNLIPVGPVLNEGFESATFPPEGWTQIITDAGSQNSLGVFPTWCRVGTVALNPPIVPPQGSFQAGLWWSYNHQDEWLISPQFRCPASASLEFKSYVFRGSTNGDHYYVKVSTDNGGTWTVLWDASAQTGGQNSYTTPITISLGSYSGQYIKLAWNASDPPSNDGLWYVWFIDDIRVTGTISNEDLYIPAGNMALHGNYPNPFNPTTNVSFTIDKPQHVSITVYNARGQLVRTLVNEFRSSGTQTVVFDGKDDMGASLSSGIYFYKMKSGRFSSTKKTILMK